MFHWLYHRSVNLLGRTAFPELDNDAELLENLLLALGLGLKISCSSSGVGPAFPPSLRSLLEEIRRLLLEILRLEKAASGAIFNVHRHAATIGSFLARRLLFSTALWIHLL